VELDVSGLGVGWAENVATEELVGAHVAFGWRVVNVGGPCRAKDEFVLTPQNLHHIDRLAGREDVLLPDQMSEKVDLNT